MIYGKLPVSFLMALASEKNGSTNSAIAQTLLENLDAVRGMGIRELAAFCHVAPSSVSRFCRELGFEGYAELREVLETARLYYERPSAAAGPRRRAEEYLQKTADSLRLAAASDDLPKLRKLCCEIDHYPRVAAFGLLKAEAAAISLQCDLLMLGRQIYTNASYAQQMDYILSAGEEDLILLFSCTGSYFEYHEPGEYRDKLYKPRIWMIAGEKKPREDYIDETVYYPSAHSQAGHPYQLLWIAGLIAQEYAAYLDGKEDKTGGK